MARVLVRLKLALLASMFRSWSAAVGYVLPALYGLPLAGTLAAALVGTGRSGSPAGPPLVVLGLTGLGIGWTLGPVLAGGLDSTVDPDTLALFPLTRLERARGLLAAGAVGIAPVLTAVVCLGAVVGFAPPSLGAVVVVLAAALEVALCLLVARAVTSTLSTALRGRRRRDLLSLVGFVAVVVASQLPNLAVRAGASSGGAIRAVAGFRTAARVAGLLPWGWPAHAIVDAAAGRSLPALGWLALSAGLVAAVGALWLRDLGRTGGDTAAVVVGSRRTLGLDTRLSRLLPAGPLRACVAKDQHYLGRDPVLRLSVASVFLLSFVVALVLGSSLVRHAPFVAVVVAPMAALATANCLGVDRGASWTLLAAGVPWRTVLTSKVLTFSVVFVPLLVVLGVGAGLVTGTTRQAPVAVLLAVGMYAAALGGTVCGSVLFPVPLPVARVGAGLFASRTGGNGSANLLQAVLLVGALALAAPALAGVAVAAGATGGPQSRVTVLAGVGSLVYGAGLFALGFHLASRRLTGRGPEMVVALSAERT